MQEIVAKGILSAKNNMNIYRGCTHGCIYCDSRSDCYGIVDFENVAVKVNAAELLDQTLRKRRQRCMITTGAMTDPYLPLEADRKLMRQCLEVIEAHGFGVSVLTKSDLVLRDLDLFARIHQKAKCVVQMTLTTFDEQLCRIIEPHVCPTQKRFEALCALREAGIPTIVWLTPLLPFLNDTIENVSGLLSYCKQAAVHGILTFGCGMTLRSGNRQYFYAQLDRHFPGLKQRYQRAYGTSYGIGCPDGKALAALIRNFCKQNQMLYRTQEVFDFLTQLPESSKQLSLWDL